MLFGNDTLIQDLNPEIETNNIFADLNKRIACSLTQVLQSQTIESSSNSCPFVDALCFDHNRPLIRVATTQFNRKMRHPQILFQDIERIYGPLWPSHASTCGALWINKFPPEKYKSSVKSECMGWKHSSELLKLSFAESSNEEFFTLAWNSSTIDTFLKREINKSRQLLSANAYVHSYERYGCEKLHMDECLEILETTIEKYQ
ncbi:hypothetical protein Ciccas_000143 [Cichlidogyrus casuarinus]|uniref:Uncharacterized protein n=1 Tax=Cichlidogyrus casuarinus TaxID=1844966 RepID=A0ABD2QRS8_9PLAT